MSFGYQPPPYQPGVPPYQSGVPGQPGGQPGFQPNFQPNAPPAYMQAAPGGRCAIIRNVTSGLCLDATEMDVKLQHYNGSPAQQWMLEPIDGTRYILRNRANGAVLDIEGGPDCGAHLITYEGHGGINQQWYINPDSTISSAAGPLAIDIYEGNCFPGNFLIAYDRHGGPNQQFTLQYL